MPLTETTGLHAAIATPIWRPPTFAEVARYPLPELSVLDRTLTRACSWVAFQRFSAVSGLEHVHRDMDPFVLALNHVTRFEALALPSLLMYHRQGRKVHFLADWNFQMIPGIGLLYRRSGAIVVMRKSARPRVLNALKPLYAPDSSPHDRALAHLARGHSIGIFPEGTVNRDPDRLLRGRLGAARLSLAARVPVVPGGIRCVGPDPRRPMLALTLGPPMQPPGPSSPTTLARADVRAWHGRIMTEIARLSGKSWEPLPQEPRNGTP